MHSDDVALPTKTGSVGLLVIRSAMRVSGRQSNKATISAIDQS
jgi:hypothetical protein